MQDCIGALFSSDSIRIVVLYIDPRAHRSSNAAQCRAAAAAGSAISKACLFAGELMAVRASISQESLPSASERALRHHRLRSALGRGAGQTDCSVRVAPQVMDDSPRGAASWPSPSITRQQPPHVSSPSNQQPARNSHAWPPPENFLRLRRAGQIAPMGADTVPGGRRAQKGWRSNV